MLKHCAVACNSPHEDITAAISSSSVKTKWEKKEERQLSRYTSISVWGLFFNRAFIHILFSREYLQQQDVVYPFKISADSVFHCCVWKHLEDSGSFPALWSFHGIADIKKMKTLTVSYAWCWPQMLHLIVRGASSQETVIFTTKLMHFKVVDNSTWQHGAGKPLSLTDELKLGLLLFLNGHKVSRQQLYVMHRASASHYSLFCYQTLLTNWLTCHWSFKTVVLRMMDSFVLDPVSFVSFLFFHFGQQSCVCVILYMWWK